MNALSQSVMKLLSICTIVQGSVRGYIHVEMMSTIQSFTARHVPQTLLAPWAFIIQLEYIMAF